MLPLERAGESPPGGRVRDRCSNLHLPYDMPGVHVHAAAAQCVKERFYYSGRARVAMKSLSGHVATGRDMSSAIH